MSLLGGRPVGGEGDGVGLAIISEEHSAHTRTRTHMATLTEEQWALRTKSAFESPTGN